MPCVIQKYNKFDYSIEFDEDEYFKLEIKFIYRKNNEMSTIAIKYATLHSPTIENKMMKRTQSQSLQRTAYRCR